MVTPFLDNTKKLSIFVDMSSENPQGQLNSGSFQEPDVLAQQAAASEDQMYLDQRFLPAIYTRPDALRVVGEIVDKGEYALHDLFVTIAATVETFAEEADARDDRLLGQEHPEYDGFVGNSSTTLYRKSEEQPFGFNHDIDISFEKLVPEGAEERVEEISISSDEQGLPDNDGIRYEYIVLKRGIDGKIKCYKASVEIKDISGAGKPIEEEYDIPIEGRIQLVKGLQEYLEKAPPGYPD